MIIFRKKNKFAKKKKSILKFNIFFGFENSPKTFKKSIKNSRYIRKRIPKNNRSENFLYSLTQRLLYVSFFFVYQPSIGLSQINLTVIDRMSNVICNKKESFLKSVKYFLISPVNCVKASFS